jgi:hypothetical protein
MFLGRSLVKEKKPATWNKTETKKKEKTNRPQAQTTI